MSRQPAAPKVIRTFRSPPPPVRAIQHQTLKTQNPPGSSSCPENDHSPPTTSASGATPSEMLPISRRRVSQLLASHHMLLAAIIASYSPDLPDGDDDDIPTLTNRWMTPLNDPPYVNPAPVQRARTRSQPSCRRSGATTVRKSSR
eukprot:2061904-Pyramimonas_sp.AAC.1